MEYEKLRRMREIRLELLSLGRQAIDQMRVHRDALAALKGRWDLAAGAVDRGISLLWADYEQKITGPAARAAAEMAAEFDELHAFITAPHRQPGGALEEMLRQAAWPRFKEALDASTAPMKYVGAYALLQDADRIGDAATLQVARRELPHYLTMIGEEWPDQYRVWLDLRSGLPDMGDAWAEKITDSKDVLVARMAIDWANRAAAARQLPAVMPDPNGVEGGRVTYIVEQGSR